MTWTDDRLGRRIRLTDLRVLMAVAEAGGMGKAARQLNTSQPAVSRCIADLEQELNVTLLERTPRGVEVTAYGRTLLDAAVSAVDSLRHGLQHIGSINDPSEGAIRIGGQEAIISGLLPRAFNELRARYPGIAVHVKSVASIPQQYAELRERRLDLIVGRVHPPFEDDVEAVILFEEKTHVVASATNPWAGRRGPLALAELADEPWALPVPGTLVGALFAPAFEANGVPYPPRCFAIGSIHLQLELVADSAFLAILPGSALRLNLERFGLQVLPIESPVRPSPVGILRLKGRPVTPFVESFIACLKHGLRSGVPEPVSPVGNSRHRQQPK
jgi:DNA-binding transcriptional LysR family regulator